MIIYIMWSILKLLTIVFFFTTSKPACKIEVFIPFFINKKHTHTLLLDEKISQQRIKTRNFVKDKLWNLSHLG